MYFTGFKETPVNCRAGVENIWKSELTRNVKLVLIKSNNLMRLPSCFIYISAGHMLGLYYGRQTPLRKAVQRENIREM